MSSKDKNLSKITSIDLKEAGERKIGIVISEWNNEITSALADGARKTLIEHGIDKNHIYEIEVPGSFELPLGARLLVGRENLDAVICLGCVIKGETKHDEYINNAVANGIMNLTLTSGKPIIFGVLTPNDYQQALDRAGGKHGNKGVEAAATALKMIAIKGDLKLQKSTIGFS